VVHQREQAAVAHVESHDWISLGVGYPLGRAG